MKIAVATDDGIHIADHFGRCGYFSVWEVDNDSGTRNLGITSNTATDIPPGKVVPPSEFFGESKSPAWEQGSAAGSDAPEFSPRPGLQRESIHSRIMGVLEGIEVVIAAGMGRRIVDDLSKNGKQIFITDESLVSEAVEKFATGSLDSGDPCAGGKHH